MKMMNDIPINFIDIQNLESFDKIDPILKELFNIPVSQDLKKVKSIIMIKDKGKNIARLRFGKNLKKLHLRKSARLYTIRKEGKNFILIYDSDDDKESGTKMTYVEILYDEESNESYEDRFNPLEHLNFYESTYMQDIEHHQEEIILQEIPEILPKIIIIDYDIPLKIANQDIYQRIFLRNEVSGKTLYDSLFDLNVKTSYSEKYDSIYVESINGVKNGDNDRYWEFYVNGRIGTTSVDKQILDKGDIIEWRLTEEKKGGCGGGRPPEFNNSWYKGLDSKYGIYI